MTIIDIKITNVFTDNKANPGYDHARNNINNIMVASINDGKQDQTCIDIKWEGFEFVFGP